MLSVVLAVLAAVSLDVTFGEPRRWHPLVAFGALVQRTGA
jgi:adenosylcobinamide-phosphate synthase